MQIKNFNIDLNAVRNGPVRQRTQTDCSFAAVFVLFLLGLLVLCCYAWAKGDPSQLLIGWDSDGNGCGYSQTTKDYPYLYWPEAPSAAAGAGILKNGVCVKKCPETSEDPVECSPTKYMIESSSFDGCVFKKADGKSFRYASTSFIGHFCVPKGADFTSDSKVRETFNSELFKNVLGDQWASYAFDLYQSWLVLACGALFCYVSNYLYLFLIKLGGGIMLWLSFMCTLCVFLAMGCYSFWYVPAQYVDDAPAVQYAKIFGVICWVSTIVIAILFISSIKSLLMGVAVFKTACEYMNQNLSVLFLPSVSTAISVIWYALWLLSGIYLFSVGEPRPREDYPMITEMHWSEDTRWLVAYHFFALCWINEFIFSAVQFIIGTSTCIWYFDCQSDSKDSSVTIASRWFFSFHWASVALGSLVIAVCETIRWLFESYRKKIEVLN